MLSKHITIGALLFSSLGFAQSLNELFDSALKNSNQAKLNALANDKSQALADQTVGGTLPQVSFSSKAQHNWASTKSFQEGFQGQGLPEGAVPNRLTSMDYSWNLHMEQTLNVFRLGVVYEGAQRLNQASQLENQLNNETLKLQIAQAYAQVFSARDQLALKQKIADASANTVKGSQIDFEKGSLSQVRFNMIQANGQVAQSDLEIAQSQLDQALETLSLYVGSDVQVDQLSSLEEEISKLEASQNSSQQSLQIRVLDAYVQYNDKILQYEKSQHMPSFGFFAGIQNSFTHNEGFDPDVWDAPSRYVDGDYFNYYAGINLKWSLFSGGMTSAKIKQAEIDNKIQRTQLAQSQSELEIQKKQTLAQAQSYKNSLASTKIAWESTQKFYDQTVKDHQKGLVNYADLLQSERELKESSQRYTMSKTSYLLTLIQLQLLNGQPIGDAS